MIASGESIYDSLIEEGKEIGRKEGREEMQRLLVRNRHQNGMSTIEIGKIIGFEKTEVKRLLSDGIKTT